MGPNGGGPATTAALLGDETAAFFLRDASVRLSRAVEVSLAYCIFVALLYCRLLAPGGIAGWRWFESSVFWVLVFLPLLALDWLNFRHLNKYLRVNQQRFAPHDAKRYLLIIASECSYKVLLCLYLSFKTVRARMSLQIAMMPYAAGYILHFALGHFLPLEDGERAEGCNAVASLISELGRFLQFVLVISMSLKVDRVSNVVYDWQAAFWPCWGLEGILILVVVLLLPVCLISVIIDRPRMLMLTWIVVTAMGLGVASFLAMYNIANVLAGDDCHDLPCKDATSSTCKTCRRLLNMALCPWLLFLPFFALVTTLFKSRLANALHNAWYQGAAEAAQADALPHEPQLPAPFVMFRVTATYYSRAFDPAMLVCSSSIGSTSSVVDNHIVPASASLSSTLRASHHTSSLDHATSVLSARGATFTDIVESDQLCFICMDAPPGSVLLECGHAGICVDCATYLLERPARQACCPICRGHISNALRIRAELPLPPSLFSRASHRPAATAQGSLAGPAASVSLLSSTASREQPSGEQSCDPEALQHGEASPVNCSAGSRHGGSRHGGSRLVEAAIAVAEAVGQPLAAPPWPHAARRHAVMVESLRRPPERPGWRLASLLRVTL